MDRTPSYGEEQEHCSFSRQAIVTEKTEQFPAILPWIHPNYGSIHGREKASRTVGG
jgi:hypothetical protein